LRRVADLVRIPSENTPPVGSERGCQEYVVKELRGLGLEAETYSPDSVPGLAEHPVYRPGRDYSDRPNVIGVWKGVGDGRSLILSGHADTVPRGSEPWTRDPFGAEVDGNLLYGLGANDMKGGISAMILAVEILRELGVRLRGDLMVETIVDEEFGGVNGTLAARLRGHNADAAILCEPSLFAICPAQTGGRTVHIRVRSGGAGILYGRDSQSSSSAQLCYLLSRIEEFAEQRRRKAPRHPLYPSVERAVPVWVTKISSGGWGPKEPITVPASLNLEVYWQAMPGETEEQIDLEFNDWLERTISLRPGLFPDRPQVHLPIRWLPGSAIAAGHDLVRGLSGVFSAVTGTEPKIEGIGGPCDMFVFHKHFDTPALLFGPKGGNTHAPDEWVEIDSALTVAEILARFICDWCGVDGSH
jgi:acetylornithine deacetylase